MNHPAPVYGRWRASFSLIEVMITVALTSLVIAGVLGVLIMCQKMWQATSLSMDTTMKGSLALSKMVYGVGTNIGLRSASGYVFTNMTGLSNGSWRISYSNDLEGTKHLVYDSYASNISLRQILTNAANAEVICVCVSSATVSSVSNGIGISLTIKQQNGRFMATNQLNTFVKLRNS